MARTAKKDETETKKDETTEQTETSTDSETPLTDTAPPPAPEEKPEAPKSAATPPEDDPDELVDYTAPIIMGKADQSIFVAVNGENIRIRRGVSVKIKRKFKEVLDNASEQEAAAYQYAVAAQSGSAKALADLK